VRRLPIVLLTVLAVACASTTPAAPTGRHLVLVSIDALRPEFYLDPSYDAPTLRALVSEGSHARAAESVFPTLTYPSHASIATGVRPARHGVLFNVLFQGDGPSGRWYEEAADLRASPLWMWARAAGLTTASVSWPSTLGAPIDWLVAERDYYQRKDPLPLLLAASTPRLFERIGVTPAADMFRNVPRWDAFLIATVTGIIREARPHVLLVHFVEADVVQHRAGRVGPDVKPAVARIDRHLATLRQALASAGIAERTTIIVTGDHGFQDVRNYVYPNRVFVDAGLRACPGRGSWRASAHVGGGSAAVFVNPPGDAAAIGAAEEALRREARDRYVVLTRAELDTMGAMTGAALGLEATPGWAIGSSCDRGLVEPAIGGLVGTHGFLPSRPSMATGFVAAGAGVRRGVALERIRLIDVAPTAARLLGIPAPPVEGRVLVEILENGHPSGRAKPGSPRVQ
jgi:predicted AlkP superfamily pyrophosphatase or phosphodiesterase